MKNWLFPLWVIIDVLIFVASIALWITVPEFKTLCVGVTLFAISLGALLLFVKFDEVKVFVRSRYFEKVLYHSVNVLLVVSIIAVVNYLGNRNYKEFDLTTEQRNSLSDQSKKVLDGIKTPMKVTLFAKREEWGPILNLLKLYEAQSRSISLEAVDTDLRPDIVRAKNITQNGTVILNFEGQETAFPIADELSVTNAMLKLIRKDKIVLYFVTGHQELNCSETSQEGLSVLCEKLRAQNYELKDLDLTKIVAVPNDATSVLILGPISGFLKPELELLKNYMDRGGKSFLSSGPGL